jgi:hypothetical protein
MKDKIQNALLAHRLSWVLADLRTIRDLPTRSTHPYPLLIQTICDLAERAIEYGESGGNIEEITRQVMDDQEGEQQDE